MTDNRSNAAVAEAIRDVTKRVTAVQSEFSKKLIEASLRWLEQIQIESNHAWEFVRRVNSTASAAERISSFQEWIEGVTERGGEDAIYAIETARALSDIEMKLFARPAESRATVELAA